MNSNLFMTTAVVLGLVAPATVLAQQNGQAQQPVQEQQASQARSPDGQGVQQALQQLREAQQTFEQGDEQKVQQARQDARDALNRIRQALRDGGGPEVMRNIDEAERKLSAEGKLDPNAAADAIALVISDVDRVATAQADAGDADRTRIQVQQPSPDITVQQAQPQVTVQQPSPDITIRQPQPQVTVRQPEPEVTVQQAEPDVTVKQAEPQVTVERAEPDVTVKQTGQPDTAASGGPVAETDPAEAGAAAAGGAAGSAIKAEEMIGRDVVGMDGEKLGEISDLVLGSDGEIQRAIVSRGGFLGIGEEKIAVDWDRLRLDASGDKDQVVLSMTKEEVDALPEYQYAEGDNVVVGPKTE